MTVFVDRAEFDTKGTAFGSSTNKEKRRITHLNNLIADGRGLSLR